MNDSSLRIMIECSAGQQAAPVPAAKSGLTEEDVRSLGDRQSNRGAPEPARFLHHESAPDGRTTLEVHAGEFGDSLPDCDRSRWPDALLVAAVQVERPDPKALNVLATRFGQALRQRCLRLTGNWDKADDLAQETWCRLLRNRRSLRSDKNFRGYLMTVATNIWRDQYRSSRRAGAMGEARLVALDASSSTENDEALSAFNLSAANGGGPNTLAESVPDMHEVEGRMQRLLLEDIQHVLARLSSLHREVLLARFIREESCALIGRRYSRTEQAISGWVRDALCQARHHLEGMNQPRRREGMFKR